MHTFASPLDIVCNVHQFEYVQSELSHFSYELHACNDEWRQVLFAVLFKFYIGTFDSAWNRSVPYRIIIIVTRVDFIDEINWKTTKDKENNMQINWGHLSVYTKLEPLMHLLLLTHLIHMYTIQMHNVYAYISIRLAVSLANK